MELKTEQNNKGFTLVETMIAVSILVVAILGPLNIAATALRTAYYASDQVTAFYLAQEGIEYMRYIRDNNFINQQTGGSIEWNDGSSLCDVALGNVKCGLDSSKIFEPGADPLLPGAQNYLAHPVYRDQDGGYRQGSAGEAALEGWVKTNFHRTISVEHIGPHEDKVTVVVRWKTGNLSSPTNFDITENMYNWLGADES